MSTIRKKIISLLEKDQLTARDLSVGLSIMEKEVYDHLVHIQRSVKPRKKKLIITPCECVSCGYIFKDRQRLTKPGRCPKCRRERIEPALFRIKQI